MSRSARLLDLIQMLRRYRRPVAGHTLAAELGVSIRTLYRDIATLQAQGAHIAGEPGLGYVLRPGFMLPPLMFSEDEIEALVLGSQWLADRADPRLAAAARNTLAKIAAVLPADLVEHLEASGLMVVAGVVASDGIDLGIVRRAIRAEHKLAITYRDESGAETRRLIWPFALGYFERVRLVVAWCELRRDYRNFRSDRIVGWAETADRYPRRRHALLKEWKEREGITTARN